MTRSTVLIVTPEQTRSLEIDVRWLCWLRPALIGLTVSTVTLGAALWMVATRYLSEHESSARQVADLQRQVTDLRNFTSDEINAKLAALHKSEQMVNDVAQYLKARGIDVQPVSVAPRKGMPNPAAGGVPLPISSIGKSVPYTGSFAHDTENLLQALQGTPLGAPHGGSLSSRFGMRPNPFTGRGAELHGGLDFKGDVGDPVHCTANGKVVLAKRQKSGYGNMVEVVHENGYVTVYAHLSRIDVRPGQQVHAGDVLGALGSSGRSTGPHLHYEVQHDAWRLDPETFLSLTSAAPAAAR
ncbi:MAG: M23 family metallopeptidase [Burkholderiaceae bacterium]|jgi:murein DD-endopeptidase MepM/ murein hydrolase activator NlpD|nr:M23 family metallopeptidase [Burkholderiaceae bacterium]